MADTRLDTDITKPSVTQPGDGAHDTTDPNERASTVTPRPGLDAIRTGTVNGAVPIPPTDTPTRRRAGRKEEYEAVKPDGTKVTVVHDLDSGETSVKAPSTDTGSHRTQN